MAISNNVFDNFPNDPQYYLFWEDFDDILALTSNQPVSASSEWIGTALTSGTFAQTTNAKFGEAVLSAAGTTDNSGTQIQSDFGPIAFALGKSTWFLSRAKLSDSTQSELFLGFAISDTTLLDGTGTLAAGLTHTDSVGFYKPDGEQNFYGVIRSASVQANTGSIAIAADATYITLAIRIDMDPTTAAKGTAYFFANGVQVGQIASLTMPSDSAGIAHKVSAAFVSGDATGTKTATLDYLGARIQR